MSTPAAWFSVREQGQKARWFGLLPWQPRMVVRDPASTHAAAFAVARGSSLRLDLPSAGLGRSRGLATLREEQRHRGTVHVAGIDVTLDSDEIPTRPPWPGAHQDDPSESAWQEQAGGGPDPQISFARLLAAVLQLPIEAMLAPDGVLTWPHPLLPYQVEGILTLVQHASLLLADDMGLGKTVQAIGALRVLLHQRRAQSALAVVPAGLIAQWRAEIKKWAPELRVSTLYGGEPRERAWQWRVPAHLYLTSYETLRMDFTENPHAAIARRWDLVILDEAQRIKNADTDISRVCKRLRRLRSWALTGTPLENSVDDLASILQWVEQEPPRASWHLVSHAELRSRLSRVQLRRRKADVLDDLPPKLESTILLPLTPEQRAAYDRAEEQGIIELRALGDAVRIQNVLELIVRLKQICNFDPRTGRSSKLDDLRERVRTLVVEGHKALVFTQFANPETGARAIAARLGVPALAYTGALSLAERTQMLERFRQGDEYMVLVLALRAGGQGLNLQEASYVFHFDRWWNPAVEQQAEARSHRLGQQVPVHVYTYVCEGTIEERIEGILREKQQLFDQIVDDASIDIASELTGDELYGLFGLRDPRGASE